MVGPSPAVAAARLAVRSDLQECAGQIVVAAVSGGPDSIALVASLAFEAARTTPTCRVIAATVDHHWHPESTQVAQQVGQICGDLGVEHHILAAPTDQPQAPSGGLEAHARNIRYALLEQLCNKTSATALFVGHTRNDQAETVLMGLARGSGLRSLAGMEPRRGLLRRPFLALSRHQTHTVCHDLNLPTWHDPANTDPRFLRVRTRRAAIPTLSEAFSQDVTIPLARTATLVRQDLDCLDQIAADLYHQVRTTTPASQTTPADHIAITIKPLATAHIAILSRVVRLAAIDAGCPPAALGSRHIDAAVRLITHWKGQGATQLPGSVDAYREDSLLLFGVKQ